MDKESQNLVKCLARKIKNDCRKSGNRLESINIECYNYIDNTLNIEFFGFFKKKDFGIWETYSKNLKGLNFISGNSIYR